MADYYSLLSRRVKNAARPLVFCFLITIFCQNSSAACSPNTKDVEWFDQTIKVWKTVRRDQLKLRPASLPWIVLFDEKCVLNINPDLRRFRGAGLSKADRRSFSGEPVIVYSAEHNGAIVLPDEQKIPAQIVSFAANYDNDRSSYFVAALPSIWARAEHLKGEKNLETLVRAVYVHELTHTYHRNFFSRLSSLEREIAVDDFDDDIIQKIFSKDEHFRKSYEKEISLANSAADELKRAEKRVAAMQLLDAIRQRREQFYTGDKEKFEEVENIFLTMEGVANWAGYRAAIADGLSSQDASRLIRRGGKNWSQEEGILLFMIIDKLLPNWQRTAFGDKRVSIVDLLERAVR